MTGNSYAVPRLSRRGLLRTGSGLLGAAALGQGIARAAPAPLGTWPAGVAGSTVFVGICLPRTGTYAVPGEDELKGYELAIEHLNAGNALIRKISPHTTKGMLGKEVKFGVADSEAKPNTAVQAQSRFISENKAMMIGGSVSSAVAVAVNKLAAAGAGDLPARHHRVERHHRQGLRALFVPPVLLCPDRGRGDRAA